MASLPIEIMRLVDNLVGIEVRKHVGQLQAQTNKVARAVVQRVDTLPSTHDLDPASGYHSGTLPEADVAFDVTGGHSHNGVDSRQVDHGALGGLSDDDHTQYALLAGRGGGQSLIGGTAIGDNLTLQSTSNATKGKIVLGGSSAYDEVNDRLGIGTTTPSAKLHIVGGSITANDSAGSLLYAIGLNRPETSGPMLYDKDGSLLTLGGSSTSIGIAITSAGDVGIGTNTPAESLDVSGAVKVGTTSNINAGTIRWTGSDFEGYDGSQWVSLTETGLGRVATGTVYLDGSTADATVDPGFGAVPMAVVCTRPGTSNVYEPRVDYSTYSTSYYVTATVNSGGTIYIKAHAVYAGYLIRWTAITTV